MGWKKEYNNSNDDRLNKQLLLSAAEGNLKEAESCILQGADVHCREPELGWTPLHVACYRRNPEIVELLLDKKANPNLSASDGYTPLRLTVILGNSCVGDEQAEMDCCRIAEALLVHGADPFGCVDPRSSSSPLHIATENGQLTMVELLVEYGAFFHVAPPSQNNGMVNTETPSNWTPLAVACRQGHSHIVDYLLEHVMPPTIVLGDSALMLPFKEACRNFHADCVVRLLRYGLEIMYENLDENVGAVLEPLLSTITEKNSRNNKEDKGGEDENEGDKGEREDPRKLQKKHETFKFEVLREACRSQMVDVIAPLLPYVDARKVMTHKESEEGGTKLGIKCEDDHLPSPLSIRRALLSAVDPIRQETVLHRVCAKKDLMWVRRLLEIAQEEGNVVKDEQETSNEDASSEFPRNAMDGLVGAVNIDQQTALHVACQEGFLLGVHHLLDFAEPYVALGREDINGNTPLMLTERHDVARCLLRLDQKLAGNMVNRRNPLTGHTRLHTAAFKGKFDLCQVLLEFGADPNIPDSHGCTSLFLASAQGFSEIVRGLLAYGADPNIATVSVAEKIEEEEINIAFVAGDTPLHVACRSGHLSIAVHLSTADVHAVNSERQTPLHLACKLGHVKVVEYLLDERKAPLHVADAQQTGCTPFELACASGCLDVIYHALRYHSLHLFGQPCKKKLNVVRRKLPRHKIHEDDAIVQHKRVFGDIVEVEADWGEDGNVSRPCESSYTFSSEDFSFHRSEVSCYSAASDDYSLIRSERVLGLGKFLGEMSWGDEAYSCGRTVSTCTTCTTNDDDYTAEQAENETGASKVLETDLSWEFWKNFYKNDVF